jgi:hypothetical protein
LADNKAQLTRLLDLYLSGNLPMEMLTECKVKLETTINALEKERNALSTQINVNRLDDKQIRSIKEFALSVVKDLELVESDFDTKREVIELLNVQVTLTIENEQKVVYRQCRLGTTTISITSTVTGGSPAGLAPCKPSWTRFCPEPPACAS